MVNPLFLWPFSIAMFVYQRVMDQCLFIICFHSKTHVFAVGFCSRKLQLPHWPGRQESCSLTDPLLRSPEWLSLHRSSRLHRVYIHKHPHGMWPFVCVCLYLCIYTYIIIYIYYMYRVYRPAKIYPWWVWYGVVMKCDHQFVIFCNHMQ